MRNAQREVELKAWTLEQLLATGDIDKGAVVASEYSIPSEDVRVDLAILAEQFIGIEIKSPFDSLKRLSAQIESYQRIFDRTIIVCASKHIGDVIHCFDDVELWEVTSDYRLGRRQRPRQLGKSVPIRQAMARASGRGFTPGGTDDPYEVLTASFRHKFSKSSAQFWKATRGATVKAANIEMLSRFRGRRQMQAAAKKREKEFWENWSSQAEEFFGSNSHSIQSPSVA